jgi:hypothetical protein
MKRLGIFLLGVFLLVGSMAAQDQTKQDTSKAVTRDSLEQLYMNDDLDAREAILLKKLDAKQLMDLETMRLNEQGKNNMPFSGTGLMLICLAPFIMVILIVYFVSRESAKKDKLRYEISMKALELGQPLPESFFDEPKKKTSRLQSGLVWLGVGIAIVIASYVVDIEKMFLFGIIPAFAGLGILIAYFVEKPKNKTPEVNE